MKTLKIIFKFFVLQKKDAIGKNKQEYEAENIMKVPEK